MEKSGSRLGEETFASRLGQVHSKLDRSHPVCVPSTDKARRSSFMDLLACQTLGHELCAWSIFENAVQLRRTAFFAAFICFYDLVGHLGYTLAIHYV